MKLINTLQIIALIFLSINTIPANKIQTNGVSVVWGDSRTGATQSFSVSRTGEQFETYGIQAAAPAAVLGSQPFVSIMCKCAGLSDEPKSLTYFKNMYSSSYPGLNHYWREVSYNKINLSGSTAAGWYTLPHDKAYYFSNNDYLYNIAKDCTSLADTDIDFTLFKGVNLMINGDMDYSYGGKLSIELDGILADWQMTWMASWGYKDIIAVEHEMGHAFGLSHSSAFDYEYANQWDVMSDIWSNCEVATHKVYGCVGQGTIAHHKDKLGWIGAGRKYTAKYKSATVTLEQLELPQTNHYLMIQIPIKGSSSHFYTVEVRAKTGYDRKLPIKTVIIHEVHTTDSDNIVAATLITKPREMWVVGRKFIDVKNGISVTVVSATVTGYKVLITNSSIP